MQRKLLEGTQKMGPRTFQLEKIKFSQQMFEGDVEPDLDEDDDNENLVQRIQVNYIAKKEPRYDKQGRCIQKGKDYGVSFDQYITVCLYDPREEVQWVRRQLEEYQTNQPRKTNYKQEQVISKNETCITLYSLLKKK